MSDAERGAVDWHSAYSALLSRCWFWCRCVNA